MKVTKRILAIVMTALMLLGTCGVAASAANSLQAAIDAASAGDTVTMTGDTTESVVINKDLTLDLGGYELKSVPGSSAITINNAEVTITNGHVVSQFANVKSLTMMETVVNESPAAISVKGGSVTVEGVRAVGSMTRIPTTSKYHFPTGSAIALTDGADATVKQSSLVGRYGVNNKVTDATAGGSVKIEDAIMMGFIRAVKGSYEVGDDTEEVNAADRIEGFLNSSKKLEERERRILKTVFGKRVMIFTKFEEDPALFAYSLCSGKFIVTAHVDDSNVWQNNTSTDCSYKYVPEYIRLEDGTLIKMTEDGDAYTATLTEDQVNNGFDVKYRLTFVMQPDIESLTNNFDMYLEDLYGKVIKTMGEVYDYALEKYTTYTKMVGDIMLKLDRVGSEYIGSRRIADIDEFNRLRRAIVDIGGATCYNAGDRSLPFDSLVLQAYYGDSSLTYQEDDIVGTIDRVAKLKAELESFMPFSDQSKMADLGYWAFENYPEVLDIIDEALDRIDTLQTILDGDLERMIIEKANLQSKRAQLDKVQKITSDGKAAISKILESGTVQNLIQKANNNKSELKPYINKFIYIYNHHEDYFTPSKFVNGNLAKAYAVYGGADMDGEPINDHQFGDWEEKDEDLHERTCERCGATEEAEHDFDRVVVDKTCTQDGSVTYTCSDCGYTYTETDTATGHEWGDWEYKDADVHERFCDVCQDSETEAHNYVEDPNAPGTIPASCTEGGVRVLVCEGCGDSYTEDTDPLDHEWDSGVVTNPTCTEPGYTTFTCTRCFDTYTETGDAALGHDFENSDWLISNEDPQHQHMRVCDRCGIAYEYGDHDFDREDTPATCTEPAKTTYTCKDCEYTYTETGDGADGHDWGDWVSKDDTYHERTCVVCGATEESEHDFDVSITEPTCTEPGKTTYTCSDCGYTYDVDGNPETGHSWSAWEYASDTEHERFCQNDGCTETETAQHSVTETGRTEPTCTEPGTVTYSCTDCDYTYTEETDPANGHQPGDAQIENETPATCGEDGKHDEVVYCTECGEELSRTTVTDPATGNHDFDHSEWLIADANQHVRTCDVCGALDYADHEFEKTGETTVDATCTEGGSVTTEYTCKDCEYSYTVTVPTDALGHTPGQTQIENVTPATCTEPGSHDEVVYCTKCDDELSRTTVTDPALGHDWGEWVETRPATQDEDGEETRTCQRCHETETRPIPKLAPAELTLTDSITHQEPANRISVRVPYSRRGKLAVTLTASEDDVTWTSSKPRLMTVDENGNVTFTRLCIFCRSATITATTPDGRTASCVVSLKLKWWQYIIWLLFGSLWF